MGHDYQQSKKIALKTILILAVITVVEVLIALTGKGYIIEGMEWNPYVMGLIMISLSLYKAYLIVGEFMHLGHEVRAMGMSVILPMLLLVWAIIAFMQEGGAWKDRREYVKDKNEAEVEGSIRSQEGMLLDSDVKRIGNQ